MSEMAYKTMSETSYIEHYEKEIIDSRIEEGIIDCGDAKVVVKAIGGRYTAQQIKCKTKAYLVATSSGKIEITNLIADTVEIRVIDSATIVITNIQAKTVGIWVENASTLLLMGGEIRDLSGTLTASCCGYFKGVVTGNSTVVPEKGSKWNAGCP
jgi:hypothetical protein